MRTDVGDLRRRRTCRRVTQSSLAEQRVGAVAGSPTAAEARVPPNMRAGCGSSSAAEARVPPNMRAGCVGTGELYVTLSDGLPAGVCVCHGGSWRRLRA
jgi:hypothetical protein